MNDDMRIPVSLPLDRDGFLRRECPACEREFKWFSHQEGDPDAESVEIYFCPLCGAAAPTDSWWTPAQLEHIEAASAPQVDQLIQDSLKDVFKGMKGVTFKPDRSYSRDAATPPALIEPDDMTIAEPPCHPNEPVKVPEENTSKIYCLVCGDVFRV